MADAIHHLALTLSHFFGGDAVTLVPASGSGPVSCSAVIIPFHDPIAEFGLRELLGADRPGWSVNFDQRDVLVRPKAGDRVTRGDETFQLKRVKADAMNTGWLCTGFLVTPAIPSVAEAFMLPIYFAGTTELGL